MESCPAHIAGKNQERRDREETKLIIINCNTPLSNNVVKAGVREGNV